MAVCKACGREMLTAKGCIDSVISIAGKEYPRIKAGDPGDFLYGASPDTRCGDCGAQPGGYHHWGCDCERCPKCHRQLLSCDCEDVYLSVPADRKDGGSDESD